MKATDANGDGEPDDPTTVRGDFCEHGTYCASGSIQETACSAGYFCPNRMQSEVDLVNNKCHEGFYCSGGANIGTPNNCLTGSGTANCFNEDTSDGGYCPQGKYCTEQSSVASSCNAGTFLNYEMGTSSADCKACPYGYFC